MIIYTHPSLDDGEKIYSLHADGMSSRKIATAIGRTTSTVSREIKRNTSKVCYLPDRDQSKALARKHKPGYKIQKYPQLKQFIIDRLTVDKWSPEIIAARLKYSDFPTISHESTRHL